MMANLSRRQFLTRTSLTVAAGAAAAAGGPQVAGLLGSAEAVGTKAKAPATAAARTAEEPVVAYVRGGANAEVTVMAGHRKIVRTDPDLVRRLLGALD
jgi:hypothetical protein